MCNGSASGPPAGDSSGDGGHTCGFFSAQKLVLEQTPTRSDMRVVLFAAVASALELSGDTFEAEVFGSGKNSFIKFLAPW